MHFFPLDFKNVFSCQSRFREKFGHFKLRNVHLLDYPGIQQCYNTLLTNFRNFLSRCRLQEVKIKQNFKLLALKVVAAAYERWSLSHLARKLLLFWKTGY